MATNPAIDPYAIISRRLIEENLLEALTAVEEYWTEDRLLEAQPIGREAEPDPLIEALLEESFEPEGDAVLNMSLLGTAGVADLDLGGVPAGSYRTERVPDRALFPYAAVGKLFMTFDGRNYVGSAWVTADRGIFTAGHCVFDEAVEDGWADRVLFIPQFHQGAEPLGRWAVTELHTLAGWAAGGVDKYKYDMGAGRLDRPIGGQTGVMGWMANHPPDQSPYQAIGYPARYLSPAYPFDGQEMWRCDGGYLGGQNPIKMANNMTQGCSGGPRLTLRDGEIYANGLNSFRWSNEPDTMYSPYFGQGFLNLLNAI